MVSDPKFAAWTLDLVLECDTRAIGDLPLCRVLLSRDANYPWLLLVPRRKGAVEIIDLDQCDRTQLMSEIADVSRALKSITGCDKINVAAIGNVVAQLHVHVIARFHADAAWPKPVWNAAPAREYQAAIATGLIAAVRKELSLKPL
jgi:diadenosine tetraphosphate (Ap4A) HIT family hydrolase